MKPPSILRLLRMSMSVLCVLACAIFIVLWTRSYNWWDRIQAPLPFSFARHLQFDSLGGQAKLSLYKKWAEEHPRWEMRTVVFDHALKSQWNEFQAHSVRGFAAVLGGNVTSVIIPHWFSVSLLGLISAALGADLWMRWNRRFSLRTLLIATTFVALLLGLIAVAIR